MVWDGRHYYLSFLHAVGNRSYPILTSKTLNDKIVDIDNSLSQQNKNKNAKIFYSFHLESDQKIIVVC